MIAKFWDERAARILFTALVFVAVLAFFRSARETITLFLFAVLFAYLVEPLVERLERPLHGRVKAIGAVYLILIALLVGFGFVIGPKIADEGKSLMATLPSLLDRIASGQVIHQVGAKHGWSSDRVAQIQSVFLSHRAEILGYGQAAAASLAEPAAHIWWLILIPILSLFFLKDGADIRSGLIDFGKTEQYRVTMAGIVQDVNVMLGSYIRAQLILAALTVAALTIVLSIMRAPYSFILGPVAGICEFIPVVGPAVAAVAIFGIAALAGYQHLVWLFVFLGAWRLIQDYVNAPRIMGKSLEMSPLAQIFGVLAGGEIGGVVGALVSVPVMAILRILWRRLNAGENSDASASSTLSPPPPALAHAEGARPSSQLSAAR